MIHITQDLYLQPDFVETLNKARIGWQTVTFDATATADSEEVGFEADSVLNPLTYERWKPTSLPAELVIDAGEIADIDYIGIAAHTLRGNSVTLSYSDDDVTYTQIIDFVPGDNGAIMVLFDEVATRYIKIEINGSGDIPEIGVVYAGLALQMQRAIYQGHSPGNLSRSSTQRPQVTEGGQWIGRVVTRRGYQTSYNWSNLDADWYRENFEPFVKAAISRPWFIAWRPNKFPDEVLYAWTDDDIQPTNSGPRNLMQVTVAANGFSDDQEIPLPGSGS